MDAASIATGAATYGGSATSSSLPLGGPPGSGPLAGGGPSTTSLLDGRPPEPPRRKRFSEPQKFLPVAFVVLVILFLFCSYLWHHIRPLLQLGGRGRGPGGAINASMQQRAQVELIIFLCITTMLVICYVRSILVHPGAIPDNDPLWEYSAADGRTNPDIVPMALQEMKKTGERRHCKWCGKYKPDRCHHCRVCKSCILKMDHHCPWIYNCVGFANYKFFFLLLFYSMLATHFITWTMLESVTWCIYEPSAPFMRMFLTFFTVTLSFFLACLVTAFFGFHIWLTLWAMTTIEFCEKRLPKKDSDGSRGETSVYDLGFCGNLRAVLGNNMLFWFFPCDRPPGDGLNFMSDETRLTKDLESGKGIRRRSHQRTQRTMRTPRGTPLLPGGYYSSMGFGGR